MTTPTASPALCLDGVRKSFRRETGETVLALDNISYSVGHGGLAALVGPDGAGKTTLIRLLAGLMKADGGTVNVLGIDAAKDPQAIQSRISYMPQKFGLYDDLTVLENLDLYANLHGVTAEEKRTQYTRLMEMTGLDPFQKRLAGKLSGGMKQKLGLACTLVRSPELLLLDEPTVGVDPLSRRELWEIIRRLVKEGMTVLISSSFLDEAEACESVLVLNEGRKLAEGQPAEVSSLALGRTFLSQPPEGMKPRDFQAQLLVEPDIVDAVPEGGQIRIVSNAKSPESLSACSMTHPKGGLEAEFRADTPPPPPNSRYPVANVDNQALNPLPDPLPTVAQSRCNAKIAKDWNESGRSEPRMFAGAAAEPTPVRFEDGFMVLLQGAGRAKANPTRAEASRPEKPAADSARGGTVVEVHDLNRSFGKFMAVDHVNFSVQRGEIFGLLGPNGAGKTTTFRMLCGLLPPSGGTLTVAGIDVRQASASARQHLGYVAQKFSLYGQLTVGENLDFFARAYGLGGGKKRERIAWAMSQFELGPFVHLPSEQLPGGFKQRLAMAAALLHRPQILFLDEPTSGADPFARREFWQRITALATNGVTVIVTTHLMAEAEYCDRAAILDKGKILAQGTPAELRAHAPAEAGHKTTMEDAFIAIVLEARGPPAGQSGEKPS